MRKFDMHVVLGIFVVAIIVVMMYLVWPSGSESITYSQTQRIDVEAVPGTFRFWQSRIDSTVTLDSISVGMTDGQVMVVKFVGQKQSEAAP